MNYMKKIAYLPILAISALSMMLMPACNPIEPDPDPDPGPEKDTVTVFDATKDKLTVTEEYRACWVATVQSLDWPSSTSAAAQQTQLKSMFESLKFVGMNAVIFQVVSNSDAMYKSAILPWAKQLTGTQGQGPGYDPLEFAVQTAHELGMELHAWINPLRIGSSSTQLCDTHPAVLHPERVQRYNGSLYWNPGRPDVIQYLADVATELVTNYDIDGLHIDDYFYPSGLKSDAKEWDDLKEYSAYGAGQSLDGWRYSNINTLVNALNESVKRVDPQVLFGVSPAGRIPNTQALYADPEQWIKGGYIDYLAPQIYWYTGHPTADFPTVAKTWVDIAADVPMIPGLAAYRLGETGFTSISEFYNEVQTCRQYPQMKGNCWFRANMYVLRSDFAAYLRSTIYPDACLTPRLLRSAPAVSLKAPAISLSGSIISWSAVEGAKKYAVYELKHKTAGDWTTTLVQCDEKLSFSGAANKNYAVVAICGRDRSEVSNVVFIK